MRARHEALLLRVGFDLGRHGRSDVCEWATAQILVAEVVEGPLLELGSLVGQSGEDVSGLLGTLAEEAAPGLAARIQIGLLGLMVEDGSLELESAIRSLSALAYEEGLSEEERGCIFELSDGYGLAVAGTYGTIEQLRSDFRDFVSELAQLATWDGAGPG